MPSTLVHALRTPLALLLAAILGFVVLLTLENGGTAPGSGTIKNRAATSQSSTTSAPAKPTKPGTHCPPTTGKNKHCTISSR